MFAFCLSRFLPSFSFALIPSVSHGAQGQYARKLLSDLMENYSEALRPLEDTDKALNVSLQITLSQIKDMVSIQLEVSLPNVGLDIQHLLTPATDTTLQPQAIISSHVSVSVYLHTPITASAKLKKVNFPEETTYCKTLK